LTRKFDVVIIGGGVAGVTAASAARRAQDENKSVTIAIISKEPVVYSRVSLIPLIRGEIQSLEEAMIFPREELEELGIKLFNGYEALSINFDDQTVLVKKISTKKTNKIGYQKLIITTGSIPEIPPIKNVELRGIYTVKWFNDVQDLSRCISPGMKVFVWGAGFIGLKTAEALALRSAKVTVIARSQILSRILEPDLSQLIMKEAERHNVKIMTETTLEEIGGQQRVEYVKINGKKFEADMLVLATGVRPNTRLVSETQILTRYGAIKTDEHMCTSLENVYSAGDCAEIKDMVTGKSVYRPLGSLAARTGEIAGLNIVETEAVFEGSIRHQYENLFGVHITSIGLNTKEASALGLNTRAVDIKVSNTQIIHDWILLKFPLRTHMKAVIEKGSERIVGWQTIGNLTQTSRYNVLIEDMIRSGRNIDNLQKVGLTIS
jgi:NADPH-dependent 2,4-dienoyl-CoA reductase/sulfur reductase-like enzyme